MQPFAPKAKALPIELYSVQEPQVRIELTTARLQIECSTAELLWQYIIYSILRACGGSRTRVTSLENLDNDRYMTHAVVPVGLEPTTLPL